MKMIDMHCDTLWKLMRDKDANLMRNSFCVDVQKLRQAESMAQFFACFIDVLEIEGENPYDKGYQMVLDMIARAKREFELCRKEISPALSYEALLRNDSEGKISAILTVEEGGILNHEMSRLTELYREGVRLITLTWNHENCIGYPNSREEKLMRKGLKPFGIQVVEQMNELGMIVDVSHLSDGGFWDVLRYSRKPIVASHSNARSLCAHPRNLSDEMIRALAEKGGVAGINLYPYFVNASGKATAEDVAKHITYLYNIGGEELIAMGTDFDGFGEGELELAHIGEMEVLYAAVKREGFTERQMELFQRKNAMRIIKENCYDLSSETN